MTTFSLPSLVVDNHLIPYRMAAFPVRHRRLAAIVLAICSTEFASCTAVSEPKALYLSELVLYNAG